MAEKNLNLCVLYDFYGNMLTDKQREVFEMYYSEDLSLAEIADQMEITRQGVSDAIGKARRQLSDYEEKLGLVARYRALSGQARMGLKALEEIPQDASNRDALERVRLALDNIIQIER